MFDNIKEIEVSYFWKKLNEESTYSQVGEIVVSPDGNSIRFAIKDDDATVDPDVYQSVIGFTGEDFFIKSEYFDDPSLEYDLEFIGDDNGVFEFSNEDDDERITVCIIKE